MTLEAYVSRVLKDVKEGCEKELEGEQTVNVDFEVGTVVSSGSLLEISENVAGQAGPNRLRFTVSVRVSGRQA